jgi:hypothetical protein
MDFSAVSLSNVLQLGGCLHPSLTHNVVKPVFRCEEHLYKRLRPSVGRSVRRSVPHDAIRWKTSYVAIASRRGGGRGN